MVAEFLQCPKCGFKITPEEVDSWRQPLEIEVSRIGKDKIEKFKIGDLIKEISESSKQSYIQCPECKEVGFWDLINNGSEIMSENITSLDQLAGDYVSIGIGQSATVKIKEMIRYDEEPDSKFNFTVKKDGVEKNLGYHFRIITEDDKILSISAFIFLGAIRKALSEAGFTDIKPGIVLHIDHPGKGEYNIKVKDETRK